MCWVPFTRGREGKCKRTAVYYFVIREVHFCSCDRTEILGYFKTSLNMPELSQIYLEPKFIHAKISFNLLPILGQNV